VTKEGQLFFITSTVLSRTGERGGITEVREKEDALARLKNVIKLLLQRRRLTERPIALLLMTKDDVLQNRARNAELVRDFFVEIGAFGREGLTFLSLV
jgi:hypothetical protein